MKVIALDTNILLDYFFQRKSGYARARTLFKQCDEGKISLFIPLPVLLEYEWVSRSVYDRAKTELLLTIDGLLDLPYCEIPEKNLVRAATNLYRSNRGVNFDDCLIALIVKHAGVAQFITSDRKLKKLYAKL